MGLFKDISGINNDPSQEDNLEKLALAIKMGKLYELLYDDTKLSEKEHNPSHKSCSYQLQNGTRATEKRTCRCMYYYNNENNENQLEICRKTCRYPYKWKLINSEQYRIEDYEVPPKRVVTGIGGVDLLITDIGENITYAVEVKPEQSNETIVRMIAEILTYVEDEKIKGYKPAICFFEGSKQFMQFKSLVCNEDLKFILREKEITVFYFTIKKHGEINEFEIRRYR